MATAPASHTPSAAKLRGLLFAALVLLVMSALKDLFLPAFFHFDDSAKDIPAGPYLIFGLGVAIATSFIIGYPLWLLAERTELTSPLHFAILGAAVAALIAVAGIALSQIAVTEDTRLAIMFPTLWTIAMGALAGWVARTNTGVKG